MSSQRSADSSMQPSSSEANKYKRACDPYCTYTYHTYILTMAILTMEILTMAILTMAILTIAAVHWAAFCAWLPLKTVFLGIWLSGLLTATIVTVRAAHGRLTMAYHAHPSSHGRPTWLRAAAQPGTHVAVGGAATQ